jgi:hypothetical protein
VVVAVGEVGAPVSVGAGPASEAPVVSVGGAVGIAVPDVDGDESELVAE